MGAPDSTLPAAAGRPTTVWGLLLVCSVFALYAVNLRDYFIGDDFDLIHSFFGKPPRYFFELLFRNESGDVWKSWGIDPTEGLGFLRPLKIWLLALDLRIWGANSAGFHLTSSLFFSGMAVMVYRILLLLVDRPFVAFLGAWAAAIHPVFSEVVPFITAREETIAAFLGLWAFQRFLLQRRDGGSPLPFYVLYALALMTKESAIAVGLLVAGYDLVHGRLWPGSRSALRAVVRFYAPLAGLLAVYFLLRWIAFGNFKGGDAFPTGYGSVGAFFWFHRMFFRSLFDPTLLFGAGPAWPGAAATLLLIPALIGLALRRHALGEARVRNLLFFGPLWYLGTTIVLFGTFFAVRRNGLPIIGMACFAALVVDGWLRILPARWQRGFLATSLFVPTLLFLPPTIASSLEIHRASKVVAHVRASIEERTEDLAPGSQVLLLHVPQWEVFPYYFGWGLQSALARPFTSSDVASVSTVFEPENARLNHYRTEAPGEFDRVIEFRPDDFFTDRDLRRRTERLLRDGVLRPEQLRP